MPPKKAKKDDDKGDKKKADSAAVSDAIRFFPEQKRLERLEEENMRIMLSFKGLHEHLQAQVKDQEDILQHFEREMGAKDTEIQALLSEIKTQQGLAADAVTLSQQEISRAKLECEAELAEKDLQVQALEEKLQSTQTLRDRISSLELQLKESQDTLAEERLFCRDELVRIASEQESKVSALKRSLQAKDGSVDSLVESKAQARAQEIFSDIFSQSKNVVAEVAYLHQQLQSAQDKMDKLTERNKSLQLQLEISDRRCKELMVEGGGMRVLIEQQGKRIDKFVENMHTVSAAAAAATARESAMQQLRDEIAEKDACILKLRAKFNQLALRGSGSLATDAAAQDKPAHASHPAAAGPSSSGREAHAVEQLDFLAKVFERELGVAELSSSLWFAGKKDSPRLRPSPVMAPQKLQAMLAVEAQAPPPIAGGGGGGGGDGGGGGGGGGGGAPSSAHEDAPASRPLFLARRLRPGTPPPAAALQARDSAPPTVPPLHIQQAVRRKIFQAPLSARGQLETRHSIPIGFGANTGSLMARNGGQKFRIDVPGFALLEPSVAKAPLSARESSVA